MKIGTIEQELAKCRAAFEAHPGATWAWCCHHEVHCEKLTEPYENRIRFILSDKSESERAVRLCNFRPVLDALAVQPARDAYAAAVQAARDAYAAAIQPASDDYDEAVQAADEALQKLHRKEWPRNTWSGKSIF